MRKDVLTQRLEALTEKRDALKTKALASDDIAEVKAITAQVELINDQINDVRSDISALDAEERSNPPQDAKLVNGTLVSSSKKEEREENPHATLEYREAFKAYVQRGELRGEFINTAETGAAIPITVMDEVINTVRKRYGNLYNKVRKLNVKGGIEFPVGALQATFKWITEGTVSPRQKIGDIARISFGYHTAEIRIAQSFVSSVVSLDAFEREIASVIAIAYLQAMDEGIVLGTGNGQMTGILNDARVTNVVEMTAAEFNSWKAWRKKFFSKLPLGYRAGEFIFPHSTVESYLLTMSDEVGNPVFNQATGLVVNDGDAVNPNGRFYGREISLVEPTILPDFDTASDGDVVGIFWQPYEYAINENFGFAMRRFFDEETNEWVDKALVIVDGKILNPTGFYLIKKKV